MTKEKKENKQEHENMQQSFCSDCGNDIFKVYVSEKPDLKGWLRAYCAKCGKGVTQKNAMTEEKKRGEVCIGDLTTHEVKVGQVWRN